MFTILFDIVMHLDQHLLVFIQQYGFWVYFLLALIVFSETGLVIFAFLPGDSLLFAAGTLVGTMDDAIDIRLLFLLLCVASILGNKVNYLLGRYCSNTLIKWDRFSLISERQIDRASAFYGRHGGKTIVLARFIPIIRSFVPFVAGMSKMNMRVFTFYNVVSAFIWIGSLLFAGYWFGTLPFIKDNFTLIIYSIIVVSLIPVMIAALSRK